MRALLCTAALLAGCASPPARAATCEASLYLGTDRGLTITGTCADGRSMRVLPCGPLNRRTFCEFKAPAGCAIVSLKVKTIDGEIVREQQPIAQSWCIYVESTE